jgi:hypothetical protein
MNNLELYLQDLSKVIQWLIESANELIKHGLIGNDVNTVKQQFQVHEVNKLNQFMNIIIIFIYSWFKGFYAWFN